MSSPPQARTAEEKARLVKERVELAVAAAKEKARFKAGNQTPRKPSPRPDKRKETDTGAENATPESSSGPPPLRVPAFREGRPSEACSEPFELDSRIAAQITAQLEARAPLVARQHQSYRLLIETSNPPAGSSGNGSSRSVAPPHPYLRNPPGWMLPGFSHLLGRDRDGGACPLQREDGASEVKLLDCHPWQETEVVDTVVYGGEEACKENTAGENGHFHPASEAPQRKPSKPQGPEVPDAGGNEWKHATGLGAALRLSTRLLPKP